MAASCNLMSVFSDQHRHVEIMSQFARACVHAQRLSRADRQLAVLSVSTKPLANCCFIAVSSYGTSEARCKFLRAAAVRLSGQDAGAVGRCRGR